MSVHFQSEKHTWETPQELFDALDAEFHFTIDVAASPENAKCDRYYTYIENGLARSWKGERVFLNPPYGADLARWVEKAVREDSEVTVMLVPARTETRWWSLFWDHETHRPVDGCEVRFIKGRVKFGIYILHSRFSFGFSYFFRFRGFFFLSLGRYFKTTSVILSRTSGTSFSFIRLAPCRSVACP